MAAERAAMKNHQLFARRSRISEHNQGFSLDELPYEGSGHSVRTQNFREGVNDERSRLHGCR